MYTGSVYYKCTCQGKGWGRLEIGSNTPNTIPSLMSLNLKEREVTGLSNRLTLAVTCRSAPCSNNRDTTAVWPFWQAECSGVNPSCKKKYEAMMRYSQANFSKVCLLFTYNIRWYWPSNETLFPQIIEVMRLLLQKSMHGLFCSGKKHALSHNSPITSLLHF